MVTWVPLIPALRRQKQVDPSELEASLVYRASSRTGSKTTEETLSRGRMEKGGNKYGEI